MKSKDNIFTEIILKGSVQTSLLLVTEPNSILEQSGDIIIISSNVLTSDRIKRRIPDYAPYKYREVVYQNFKRLKIFGTQETVDRFKSEVKILLDNTKSKIVCDEKMLNAQMEALLFSIVSYDINRPIRYYRENSRRNAINFYPKMAAFLKAKNLTFDKEGISLSFGEIKPSIFNLPAPKGNAHLISAMSNFFLKYYTENQPAKNLIPLTEELVFENSQKVENGIVKLDTKLLESFEYSFHFELLSVIKKFPQFPKSQRASDFNISTAQVQFIYKFLWLINYDGWKKSSYDYISPDFTQMPKNIAIHAEPIKYRMKAYLKRLRNAGWYTT